MRLEAKEMNETFNECYTQVTCTLTTADRKKRDSLKYHEVLHSNMIKTSSRKEIIRRAVIDKYLDLDAYKLRRKTGY